MEVLAEHPPPNELLLLGGPSVVCLVFSPSAGCYSSNNQMKRFNADCSDHRVALLNQGVCCVMKVNLSGLCDVHTEWMQAA